MIRTFGFFTRRPGARHARRLAGLTLSGLRWTVLSACWAAAVFPALCGAAPAEAETPHASENWWGEDVWAAPRRPFLYYGIEADDPAPRQTDAAPAASPNPSGEPAPLSGLTTVEAVRAEAQQRLSRAVMDPSPEHLSAYLEINDFLLGKAHEFADRLSRLRLQHPEWDWTASHTTMNAATAELSAMRKAAVRGMLAAAAPEIGLIFIAGSDPAMNALSAGPAGAFAAEFGFTVLAAVPRERFAELGLDPAKPIPAESEAFKALLPGLTDRPALLGPDGKPLLAVRPENGISDLLAGAGTVRPAVYAAADPNGTMPALAKLRRSGPMRLASGPTAVADLTERLAELIAPASDFGAGAKTTGELAADLMRAGALLPAPDDRGAADPHALAPYPQD